MLPMGPERPVLSGLSPQVINEGSSANGGGTGGTEAPTSPVLHCKMDLDKVSCSLSLPWGVSDTQQKGTVTKLTGIRQLKAGFLGSTRSALLPMFAWPFCGTPYDSRRGPPPMGDKEPRPPPQPALEWRWGWAYALSFPLPRVGLSGARLDTDLCQTRRTPVRDGHSVRHSSG